MEYIVKRLAAPDWARVSVAELRHQPWLAPCAIRAWAQACHDGENLYIRMTAEEREIRATLTDPLSSVCCDSCLEFFFAPERQDSRYFNLEWNPLGTLYLGFGGTRETRVRQLVQDPRTLFCPRPFRTETGWGIDYRIPAAFIRLYFPDFAFSGEKAGNFYKCGDETVCPHYLAWNDLTSAAPDYHRRQDFGRLIFE